MKKERIPIDRRALRGFLISIKQFAASETGKKARWLFLLLIIFLFGITGLNVLNSYVNRDFMTAVEHRNQAEFFRMALFYIAVFAASTVVSVFSRYTEETLGLVWREWASRRLVVSYANHRTYYRLKVKGEIGNPDQRIADDIRTFSVSTLSFLLMLLNGSFTVIAFSGVLWSISPRLFIVAVLYASGGTFLTFLLGRPLVRLNYDQLDKEADFRSSLVYLRGNAESVALSRREGHLIGVSLRNLKALAANFRRIIAVNRNVNFFTTGYNWLIQIIPVLIVAPLFFEGKVPFGVITQSAVAFAQLLGAFSLIVTQFQSISSYTATFARLASLVEASSKEKTEALSSATFVKDEDMVAYKGVTLHSPRSGRLLIRDLCLDIPRGKNVLVRGADETARAALFQATAGIWDVSEGTIARPALEQVLLLPEHPYLPPGTLRELLMRPWPEERREAERNLEAIQVSEEDVRETLRALNIEDLLTRYGGLDKRRHWENALPLDKQQLLVVARLLLAAPRFAFLDKPSTTLQPDQVDRVLDLLGKRGITYVTFEGEDRMVNLKHYDTLLYLEEDCGWCCKGIKGGRIFDGIPLAAA